MHQRDSTASQKWTWPLIMLFNTKLYTQNHPRTSTNPAVLFCFLACHQSYTPLQLILVSSDCLWITHTDMHKPRVIFVLVRCDYADGACRVLLLTKKFCIHGRYSTASTVVLLVVTVWALFRGHHFTIFLRSSAYSGTTAQNKRKTFPARTSLHSCICSQNSINLTNCVWLHQATLM